MSVRLALNYLRDNFPVVQDVSGIINDFFGEVLSLVNEPMRQFGGMMGTSEGGVISLLAFLSVVGIVLFGAMGTYFSLDLTSPILGPVFKKLTGRKLDVFYLSAMSMGLFIVITALNGFWPIDFYQRLNDGFYALSQVPMNEVQYMVDLGQFTWGITPLGPGLEFIAQCIFLIGAIYFYVERKTRHSERYVLYAIGLTVIVFAVMTVKGIKVVPMDFRFALPMLLFMVFLVSYVFVFTVRVFSYIVADILASARTTNDWSPDYPNPKTQLWNTAVLLVALFLMQPNYTLGFISWIFFMLWRVGGTLSVIKSIFGIGGSSGSEDPPTAVGGE